MSITINVNSGIVTDSSVATKEDKKSTNFFVGNGNESQKKGNPMIEQKRKLAQKNAMKLIKDAYKKDETAANSIKDMEEQKKFKGQELEEYKTKLNAIEEQKQSLAKEYGIDPESDEQKDLELLMKYQDNKNGASYDEFSREEQDRLKQLSQMPLSEYQNRVLELNDQKDAFTVRAQKLENEILSLTENVTDASIDQLKSQDMLKATEGAEKIMDAASKEILGMLIQDGKEHIKEEIKKKEEEAKEAKEEQEKKEEIREKLKEKEEKLIEGKRETDDIEQTATIDKKNFTQMEEVQKNIRRMMQDNQLINEDIKGIEIDFNF